MLFIETILVDNLVVIIFVVATILAIFMIRYLEGGYKDFVMSEKKYKRIKTNFLGHESIDYVTRVVIKRCYNNGKIKFVTKEHKS